MGPYRAKSTKAGIKIKPGGGWGGGGGVLPYISHIGTCRPRVG